MSPYLSLIAFIGGGLIGVIITVLRIIPNKFLNTFSYCYTWLFQSVPLLMLLFLLGLGIPKLVERDIDPWLAASIAFIIFTSAYLSEVWRGSILAIPKGQWEAAHALNFSPAKRIKRIIIPQIFPIILPPSIA